MGGFLGVGLVVVVQSVTAAPLLLAFFLITGLRLSFEIPATMSANWLFRFAANDIAPNPNAITRRLMMVLVLPWQFLSVGSLGRFH